MSTRDHSARKCDPIPDNKSTRPTSIVRDWDVGRIAAALACPTKESPQDPDAATRFSWLSTLFFMTPKFLGKVATTVTQS